LLLAERSADAHPSVRAAVEHRIRETGAVFFERYEIEPGQPDWRAAALNSDVWLHLSQIDKVGVLSDAGKATLVAIKAGRPHLDRAVEDQDFFNAYSYGVRRVVGDQAPITAAAPEDRLAIVKEQLESPDIEQRQGWGAFCAVDPRGAFELLADAPLVDQNLRLWAPLLSAVSHGNEATKSLREDVAADAVARLAEVAKDQLPRIAEALVDIFSYGPRARFADRETWYDRLWEAIAPNEREASGSSDLLNTAVNRPAGRLARVLLHEHQVGLAAGDASVVRQRERLAMIAAHGGVAGLYARAMFVQNIGFLVDVALALVSDILQSRIEGDEEGPGLRSVLVNYAQITPATSRVLAGAILRAACEAKPADSARSIAALILRPALAELRGDAGTQWGISAAQVRQLLRVVETSVRKAVLDLLFRWMRADEAGAEQAWLTIAQPFLAQIWPKESRFVEPANNVYLAELAVGAEAHFPAALDLIRHFIARGAEGRVNLHSIKGSNAPAAFPRQTLELLWLLFGPTGGVSHDVPELLARLIEADPAIEVDRRLQSLLQRAERF
jgi:hypothetical protein